MKKEAIKAASPNYYPNEITLPHEKEDFSSGYDSEGINSEDCEKDQIPDIPAESENTTRCKNFNQVKEERRLVPNTPGCEGASKVILKNSTHFSKEQSDCCHLPAPHALLTHTKKSLDESKQMRRSYSDRNKIICLAVKGKEEPKERSMFSENQKLPVVTTSTKSTLENSGKI